MKTRIISLLLSTALTVSVIAGCGNTGTGDTTANNTTTETTADAAENGEQVADKTESTENTDSAENTDNTDNSESVDDQAKATGSDEKSLPTTFEELISSLHAGQSYRLCSYL
ncbi:hypothetical protein [Butyrivibrio sp. AE3004]|uniref:hypothetical protein n=1 Tax=Butyrivibrio sp. AE3004 TaxID=1506994 RepID=UPI0004949C7D|nr:hypothetical protein [Butyrivibrio sp. AE3004]